MIVRPSGLSARMVPRCPSAMLRAMDSPMPKPPVSALPGREALGKQTENRVKILRAHTLNLHHSAASFSISPRSR